MSVTIYASVQDASASVTIQVKPSVVLGTLQSLVLSPASVHAGGTATGIVTLENAVGTATSVRIAAPAPGGGPTTTSPYIASLPTQVLIPAGQVQHSFPIQTKVVTGGTAGTPHNVLIMATAVAVRFATLSIA
jgi:hypothetical protein